MSAFLFLMSCLCVYFSLANLGIGSSGTNADSHSRLWKAHSASFKESVSERVRQSEHAVFAQGIYFLSSITDGSCSEPPINVGKEAGPVKRRITSSDFFQT